MHTGPRPLPHFHLFSSTLCDNQLINFTDFRLLMAVLLFFCRQHAVSTYYCLMAQSLCIDLKDFLKLSEGKERNTTLHLVPRDVTTVSL